jgi:hypothetical protein
MKKAIAILQRQASEVVESRDDEDDSEKEDYLDAMSDELDSNDDEEVALAIEPIVELPDETPHRRLPCIVHMLQQVVKQGMAHSSIPVIISKAKNIAKVIRKSSVATEKLVQLCGKSVTMDCTTRWNSTYMMCRRLLDIKHDVTNTLNVIGQDGLLASEWICLEELVGLLEPFYTQTNVLQSDATSFSAVIPDLLELEYYLKQSAGALTLTAVRKAMKEKFDDKFACILKPDSSEFNPLPAVACVLDPTLGIVMKTPQASALSDTACLNVLTHQDAAVSHDDQSNVST